MSEEEKEAIEYFIIQKNTYIDTQNKFKKDIEDKQYLNRILNELQIDIDNTNIILNLIQKQQEEIEKKDKIIKQYETEAKRWRAFCRRIRRDEKHDVDLFNQGREYAYIQFLNLIDGEKHWDYKGKYFDEVDKEVKQYFINKVKEEK